MPQPTRRRPSSRDAGRTAEADSRPLPGRRGRPARNDDDDDRAEETTTSRGRRGSKASAPVTSGGRGWATHKKNQARTKRGFGTSPDEFKVDELDTVYLVKMLEDEPYWSYCEHFINEIEEGRRSFTCGGDDCPLCGLGDNPRPYDLFNVAVWTESGTDDGSWVHKYWRATPDPAGKVCDRAEELGKGRNPRALGDEDVYLAVSKSESKKKKGGRSFNEFQIDLVKERDLDEDYGAYPISDEELDEFDGKLFDETVVPETTAKELRDAAEVLDD